MSKLAYQNGNWVTLIIEEFSKHREYQFDVSEKDHIDLYTIAELNRHGRTVDNHWFDNAVLWEKYQYAYFKSPTLEQEVTYDVERINGDPIEVHEHVIYTERRQRTEW